MKINFEDLKEDEILKLVKNRYDSSAEIWEEVDKIYKANVASYSNKSQWLETIPKRRKTYQVQANRIFVNMEAVINALIANPPGINILPARTGQIAQDFARKIEKFLLKKFTDLNAKETLRMGLRNLYFGRIICIKPFWNPKLNDFDFRVVDPRKVRYGKYARKEQDSEFFIEDIDDNVAAIIDRFPTKKEEIMKKYGLKDDADLAVKNPSCSYQEAWIEDMVIFKLDNILLGKMKNPYWDWDGILITEQEEIELKTLEGQPRRDMMQGIKLVQDQRQPVEGMEDPGNRAYYFNYFDSPRKPYIVATIFNNENTPIGQTDMITLSAELQRGIDKRKMDIDENCELANGVLKVDASVMGKQDAQRIRFETKGIIWGKGVKDGVTRETGQSLPQMVFDDMKHSEEMIDNIMAASSSFRGERQGQETKAGRLALIQQSMQRLNELTQVVDYVSAEMFSWAMQLAKTRYTEYHYAKWMGKDDAMQTIELIQDDFETGSEIYVVAGKTLPVDNEWKFEQAQNDVLNGFIAPPDYLEIAKYDNAKELSMNAVMYKQNPAQAVGIAPEAMPMPGVPGQLQPDQQIAMMEAGLPPEMPGQGAPTGPSNGKITPAKRS
jgi:hypothetical protein